MRVTRVLLGVLFVAILGFAAAFATFGFVPTASQNIVLSAPYLRGRIPLDPESSEWSVAPALSVLLSGQVFVTPQGGGTITDLTIRAFVNRSAVAVLVEWRDGTRDTATIRTEDFADAVAVQLVDIASGSAPFVCMGQAAFQTQIWHWRADRDPYAGGGLRLEDVYPDIYADWYPFENESDFYPALSVGNIVANETPVQVLVAGGAATIAPAGTATVFGAGTWEQGSWRVVFSRRLEPATSSEVPLRPGGRFAISLAAWNGSAGERDGMKATSTWIDLSLTAGPPVFVGDVLLIIFAFILLIILVLGFRRPKERGPASVDEPAREFEAPEERGESANDSGAGQSRREFLLLFGPGLAGLGVSAAVDGNLVARMAGSEGEGEDPAEWAAKRDALMAHFEDGYRKPNHLR